MVTYTIILLIKIHLCHFCFIKISTSHSLDSFTDLSISPSADLSLSDSSTNSSSDSLSDSPTDSLSDELQPNYH